MQAFLPACLPACRLVVPFPSRRGDGPSETSNQSAVYPTHTWHRISAGSYRLFARASGINGPPLSSQLEARATTKPILTVLVGPQTCVNGRLSRQSAAFTALHTSSQSSIAPVVRPRNGTPTKIRLRAETVAHTIFIIARLLNIIRLDRTARRPNLLLVVNPTRKILGLSLPTFSCFFFCPFSRSLTF